MIESPKDQSERLQNFVKRTAQELRAVYDAISNKLSKTEADSSYLGKTDQAESAKTADLASSVAWENVIGKPTVRRLKYGDIQDRDTSKPTYGIEIGGE